MDLLPPVYNSSTSPPLIMVNTLAMPQITSVLLHNNLNQIEMKSFSGDASLNYNLKYSSTPVFSNSAAHSVFVSNAIIILFLSTDF